MRLALLTDTHFGARNDSQQFLDYFLEFVENQFLPECEKQNIDTVFHLGDLMDRRKFVNFNTLNQVRERFIEKLQERNIKMYCLIGNHDTYYKNTNQVNSLTELFGERYDCFIPVNSPMDISIGGKVFGLVPWINKENKQECEDFLKNSDADIMCGHFELSGYEVLRGVKFEGGMNDNLLRRFGEVWSGHFHMRHKKNNVRYLGTPYQITFSDLHEQKGFYVYDTESGELDCIENVEKMFLHIDYTDEINIDDLSEYENKYIKMFVRKKTSQTKLDAFVDNLYDAKVGSLTIIEDDDSIIEDTDVADMSLDTLSLIYKEAEDFYETIEGINVSKLKRLIQEIYMEAISQ
jgi:DNA repair exonuclease SbcCD nuclease subunit